MPVLLLLLFSIALSIGLGIAVLVVRQARREKLAPKREVSAFSGCAYERSCEFRRPGCWLAVRSRSLAAVQSALGLHNPKPCSWIEGLAGDEKLFVAPPVKGWILVMGAGLPDPSEDVDACFRFVLRLSRKLGQVQFFSASRVLHHHAWVAADGGRVVRAYAWAGKTLWQQGARTSAEKELELKCFDYAEPVEPAAFGQPDAVLLNVDKVPLLAARWSLDPARIDQRFLERERGVAGEPSRRF
jgi:hypothetical protein